MISSFVMPSLLTLLLVFSPSDYIVTMAKTNPFSDVNYLQGSNAWYGILEVKQYLESAAKNTKIAVGVAVNTGNPESALAAYFQKSDKVFVSYLDSRQFGDALNDVDCLVLPRKLYFVSRNDEQAGLNKFLTKVKTFQNPYSSYSIGVYTLKEPCTGKSLEINAVE